jgi:hypothetical protein
LLRDEWINLNNQRKVMILARCQVCGVQLSRGAFLRNPARIEHYRNIHPDFIKWNSHFVRKLMASGLPLIAVIALANYYLAQLYGLPHYLSLIFIPYFYIAVRALRRDRARFRQDWTKTHPFDTPSQR